MILKARARFFVCLAQCTEKYELCVINETRDLAQKTIICIVTLFLAEYCGFG